MTFSGLKPGHVRDYIEAVRGGPLWVFQHIPKTAGSSLADELSRHCAPYRNLFLNYGDTSLTPIQKREKLVEVFLEEYRTARYRSVSGHLRRQNIVALCAGVPEAKVFTFVRDPVERVVSTYYYCLSPEHNDPVGFRARFPTLAQYAESEFSNNVMTSFILGNRRSPTGRGRARPEEIAPFAFGAFSFIGTQNLYELSFRLLSTLLWKTAAPQKRIRVGGPREPLDPGIARLIQENNRLDQALYDAVMETYRACEAEITAELARLSA